VPSESVLFFGCRHRNGDFLYENELSKLLSQTPNRLITAFSRDGQEKVYVQHRIRQEASLVWSALERGGKIYICGDGFHMAADVHNALVDVVVNKSKGQFATRQAADEYVKARTSMDVWST